MSGLLSAGSACNDTESSDPNADVTTAESVAEETAADASASDTAEANRDIAAQGPPMEVLLSGETSAPADVPATAETMPETSETTPASPACGGPEALACPSTQSCLYAGWTEDTPRAGRCDAAPLAGHCVEALVGCFLSGPSVCGCDGRDYMNECFATQAGVQVEKWVPCAFPAHCAEQRVYPAPGCAEPTIQGYRWQGEVCVPLVGCGCVGPDCDQLYPTADACVAAVAVCDCRATGCEGSLVCTPCVVGTATGHLCRPVDDDYCGH